MDEGINIYSGTPGLGGELTNPTALAFAKGSIDRQLPIKYQKQVYRDAEAVYQDYKPTAPTWADKQKLMTHILIIKLRKYPHLIEAIRSHGGVSWLETCEHRTLAGGPWEGRGRESAFIRCLIAAYQEVKVKKPRPRKS